MGRRVADVAQPASEQDHAELARRITGIMRAGELPPERTLSKQLGINRYALRKILAELRSQASDFPATTGRASGSARRPSRRKLVENSSPAELYALRLAIEPQVARYAALHATPRDIQALQATHECADPCVFDVELDCRFHMAIATASHNTLFVAVVELITEISRDPYFRTQLPPTSETGHTHHQGIVDAISRRDAVAAETIMTTHINAIRQWALGYQESPARSSYET